MSSLESGGGTWKCWKGSRCFQALHESPLRRWEEAKQPAAEWKDFISVLVPSFLFIKPEKVCIYLNLNLFSLSKQYMRDRFSVLLPYYLDLYSGCLKLFNKSNTVYPQNIRYLRCIYFLNVDVSAKEFVGPCVTSFMRKSRHTLLERSQWNVLIDTSTN